MSALNTETHAVIVQVFEELIPFNKVLGFRIVELRSDLARASVEMRPDLVGNPIKQVLHGGVISATLDATGGVVALAAVLSRTEPDSEIQQRSIDRLGTIDLRVDYLRPGDGERFEAVAYPMRVGGKVAVTRMEMHSVPDGEMIAVGTGTYIIG